MLTRTNLLRGLVGLMLAVSVTGCATTSSHDTTTQAAVKEEKMMSALEMEALYRVTYPKTRKIKSFQLAQAPGFLEVCFTTHCLYFHAESKATFIGSIKRMPQVSKLAANEKATIKTDIPGIRKVVLEDGETVFVSRSGFLFVGEFWPREDRGQEAIAE